MIRAPPPQRSQGRVALAQFLQSTGFLRGGLESYGGLLEVHGAIHAGKVSLLSGPCPSGVFEGHPG